MKLTPQLADKIKSTATTLFKENHFNAFDSDLQTTVCIIMAFIANYEALTGDQLQFELETRQEYTPVDDL